MEYVRQIRKDLQNSYTIFSYQGVLSQTTQRPIVSIISRRMDIEPDRLDIKRKVYITLLQCLQDVLQRYEDVPAQEQVNNQYLLLVGLSETDYNITCGYQIPNEAVEILKSQIEYLNDLGSEALRTLYNKALHTEAGEQYENKKLDLLYLRRKSNQKILYTFEALDEKTSYFAYTISISRKNLTH